MIPRLEPSGQARNARGFRLPRGASTMRTDPELGEAIAMPGRTDGPGLDPEARARPDARGRAPGSQDELRRRLADLPASHPSSPRYRDGQPAAPSGRPGRDRRPPEPAAARPDEPGAGRSGAFGAGGPGASGGARWGQSRVNRAGQPAGDRDEPAAETAGGRRSRPRRPGGRGDAGQDGPAPAPREVAGGAAAVAARLIRGGRPQVPERDAQDRRADDALWARAAAQHAAAQARRARGSAAPSRPSAPFYPLARREPFRPWFTAGGGDELWLSAERTGDPWFTQGDGER